LPAGGGRLRRPGGGAGTGAPRARPTATRHPYTAALRDAVPDPDRPQQRLPVLGSATRDPRGEPGCRFAPRCARVQSSCRRALPELDARGARCLFPLESATKPTDEAS
jgi:oligopeptide/dipeptide ABC transporter ATP-binding protein